MAYVEVPPEVIETPLQLICDDKYHALDMPVYAPVFGCSTDADVYLNVAPPTVPPKSVIAHFVINGVLVEVPIDVPSLGRLRIRMVREPWQGEPEDPTYYYDLPLWDGMGWLDTRAMFEEAEKNRPLHWEYKVTGATAVTLQTHYVKYRQVLGEVHL